MSVIKIGGFDPSMSNFGMSKGEYCTEAELLIIKELRLQKTSSSNNKSVRKNSDDLRRAKELQAAMQSFFKDVDVVCVEIPVGSQSARAMASYGMCIGILASLNKPLIQVTPSEVKIAATGSKAATKGDMIRWATGRHPELPWRARKTKGIWSLLNDNEHLADSIAAIEAAIETDQFKLLTIGK